MILKKFYATCKTNQQEKKTLGKIPIKSILSVDTFTSPNREDYKYCFAVRYLKSTSPSVAVFATSTKNDCDEWDQM